MATDNHSISDKYKLLENLKKTNIDPKHLVDQYFVNLYDLYSEKEIMNAIEKNWDDKAPEEEVANLEFAKHVNRWRSIKIVDTAGIRKAKLVDGFIETQSVYRSLRSISESEIVLFMVDSTLGITHQDRRLCDIALEKGKSIIICFY
jgi:GTP-binding protein